MVTQRLRPAQDGFTLIEVMVVVLILGVLIALGLPMFLGAKVRAEERRAQEIVHTAQTAGLSYWTQGGTFTAFDAGCTGVTDSCGVADAEEQSVRWIGPGEPAAGEVSIVFAAGNSLLLVTRSNTGELFCVTQSTAQIDRGRAVAFSDIDTVPECAGGW